MNTKRVFDVDNVPAARVALNTTFPPPTSMVAPIRSEEIDTPVLTLASPAESVTLPCSTMPLGDEMPDEPQAFMKANIAARETATRHVDVRSECGTAAIVPVLASLQSTKRDSS